MDGFLHLWRSVKGGHLMGRKTQLNPKIEGNPRGKVWHKVVGGLLAWEGPE